MESEILPYIREQGVFVYVNTGQTEPTYIAGPGRSASLEDVRAAINFLSVLRDLMQKGEA